MLYHSIFFQNHDDSNNDSGDGFVVAAYIDEDQFDYLDIMVVKEENVTTNIHSAKKNLFHSKYLSLGLESPTCVQYLLKGVV